MNIELERKYRIFDYSYNRDQSTEINVFGR